MEWKFEYLILIPLGWSLVQGIQQGKMIAAIQTQLSVVQNNLIQLKTTLDTFVKTEIDTLKEIADSVKK